MTSLPTRLRPLPDEVMYGYVGRLSEELDAPYGSVLDHLGVLRTDAGWPCLLHPTLHDSVADALGLATAAVTGMTLQAHAPTLHLPDEVQRHSLGGWAASNWVLLRENRFCPLCLAEQRTWFLSGRLPEAFGCLVHRRLLVHRCPGCGGAPNAGRGAAAHSEFREFVRDNTRCYSPAPTPRRGQGRGAQPCGARLVQARSRPLTSLEVELLERIGDVLAGTPTLLAGCVRPAPEARRLLREAYSLEFLKDNAESGLRRFRSPPADPEAVSLRLGQAAPWLLAVDEADAADQLRAGLVASRKTTLKGYRDRLGQNPVVEPLLLAALRSSGRPSSRARRIRSRVTEAVPEYLTRLPQLAWRCALPTEFLSLTNPSPRYLQAVLSLQLARRWTTTWDAAGELLGLPPGRARQWTHNVYNRLTPGQVLLLTDRADALHQLLRQAPAWSVRRSPSSKPATGLREGICRLEGAAWCTCLNDIKQ